MQILRSVAYVLLLCFLLLHVAVGERARGSLTFLDAALLAAIAAVVAMGEARRNGIRFKCFERVIGSALMNWVAFAIFLTGCAFVASRYLS